MSYFLDSRNRSLEVGQRVRIEEDIISDDGSGILAKHTIVYLESFDDESKKVKVKDRLGKIWNIKSSKTSSSFL